MGSVPYSSGGAAGDGVEADVGGFLSLEDPCVGAVFALDQLGYIVFVLGRDVAVEHVRWFDEVVIDRDQDEVVHVHGELLSVVTPIPDRTAIVLACAAKGTEIR
ncbi:hypothetical protein LTQ55_12050 [Mycobacterium intracellulare]|nr:hypothetical protein LTQ55_12050 [Mycobacterium intracellulare]